MSEPGCDGSRGFTRFSRDESAATAVEYSLIAALMSMAGIAGFLAMGDTLSGLWDSIGDDLDSGTG